MKFWPGLAVAAAATMLSACNTDFNISSSSDGVPLAELDYEGATPTGISLAGPDRVIVTSGDTLTIDVEGDSSVTEGLRFDLDDDSLGIGREGNWRRNGVATIRVTMPTPTRMSMAGSGTMTVDRLGKGGEAEISIAGSGESKVGRIDADALEVNVAGSGSLKAAGAAKTLDLSIAGSGDLDMRDVKVDSAEVAIAGSGDAAFASDGDVEASIMGSGTVEVLGNASCSVSSMGSGELKCRKRTAASGAAAEDAE
ncbi:head GIN domain-containing protein [Citromicrobium bathyomarinum]